MSNKIFFIYSRFHVRPLSQHSQINENSAIFVSCKFHEKTLPYLTESHLFSLLMPDCFYKTHILTKIQPSSFHINLTLKKFGIVPNNFVCHAPYVSCQLLNSPWFLVMYNDLILIQFVQKILVFFSLHGENSNLDISDRTKMFVWN